MSLNSILKWAITVGLIVLTAVPLLVSESLFFPFITGKGFFFRIIIEVIFSLWLILALRDPGYRPRSSWIFKAAAGFIIVLILATVFSVNSYRSFWSNYERMEGLVSYLHLFAFFLILVSVMKTERLWGWFLHSSLVVNAVIGVYSLLQLAGKLEIHQGGARVDATLGNATYLAVYVLFHIFLLSFLLSRLLNAGRWRKELSQRLAGAGYLLLLILDLLVLFQTQTRGAILGLVGGVLIAAVWLFLFSPRASRARRLASGLMIAVLVLISGFLTVKDTTLVQNSATLKRLADISLTEQTTRSRFMIWNMSWQGFKERPVLGWGPENFIVVFNKYYNPLMYDQEQWFDRAHNVFFDWLIAAGILGLLSYLSLFAVVIYYFFKNRRDGTFSIADQAVIIGLLAAYFSHNFFVFDQLVSLLLFFGLLAYLHTRFAAPWSGRVGAYLATPVPRVAITAVSVMVVINIAAGFYFVNLKPLLASRTLIQALSLQRYPEKSIKLFERVFAYDTFGSTEATEQILSLSVQTAGREDMPIEIKQKYLNLAAERAEAEIKRAPQNARYPFFAGSFYLQLGQVDLAIKRLEQARDLSPTKQTILFNLGLAYLQKGRADDALAVFRQAYELAPNFDQSRDYLINLYVETKQFDKLLVLWQEKAATAPTNADYRGSLGLSYFYAGQREQAVVEFQKVGELNPAYQPEVERVIREIRAGRDPLQ